MKKILLLMFCLSVFAFAVEAQEKTTEVRGVVVDQRGGRIERTEIVFTDESGKMFTATSNAMGEYKLSLMPGTYTIEAERSNKRGWRTWKVENYEIPENFTMTLDICLKVMPASESGVHVSTVTGDTDPDSTIRSELFWGGHVAHASLRSCFRLIHWPHHLQTQY